MLVAILSSPVLCIQIACTSQQLSLALINPFSHLSQSWLHERLQMGKQITMDHAHRPWPSGRGLDTLVIER